MKRTLRILCLVLLLGAMALQAGCEMMAPQDWEMVTSFVEEWARVQQMHPLNEDGSVNPQAVLNGLLAAATQRTGDPAADAVLDAYRLIRHLHETDRLLEQGNLEGIAAAVDEAIAQHPDDWTLRTVRSVAALALGDVATWEAQQEQALAIVARTGVDPLWFHRQSLREYGRVYAQVLDTQYCNGVLTAMIDHSAALYELTGDAAFQSRIQELEQTRATRCP